jgi:hypothetical protein
MYELTSRQCDTNRILLSQNKANFVSILRLLHISAFQIFNLVAALLLHCTASPAYLSKRPGYIKFVTFSIHMKINLFLSFVRSFVLSFVVKLVSFKFILVFFLTFR